MPRISPHTVVYNYKVLRNILQRAEQGFPKEVGGFLMSPPMKNKRDIWKVVDICYGRTSTGTKTSWWFYDKCLISAHAESASKNLIVSGIHHSHPASDDSTCMTHQSHKDAELQSECGFALSMIVAVYKTETTFETWREGFAAPMNQLIEKDGNIYTLNQWLKKNGTYWHD